MKIRRCIFADIRRLIDWLEEERLFLTHTPERFIPGQTCEWEGKKFRITKVAEISPSLRYDGGISRCYSIKGIPA